MGLWIGLFREVGLTVTVGQSGEERLDVETSRKALEYINTLTKTRVGMPMEKVWSRNITHNLGRMARQVEVADGLSLYDVMWHPEDHFERVTTKEVFPLLMKGACELRRHPDKYSEFNPENGWGNYNGLLDFALEYAGACLENPNCIIVNEG